MTTATERSVMLVDDEPGIRAALSANFLRHGWHVDVARSVHEAIHNLEGKELDLVITDIRLPDGDGIEVMRYVRQMAPGTAVILLTAYGSIPDAVNAMRSGALDYLIKPVSFEQLESAAARVLQRAKQPRPQEAISQGKIVGSSHALRRSLERARAAASTTADVLIQAESGTGKELLAKFIHEASDRCRKPFIAMNCAAVPEALLESELFGHTRGAFTGAVAAKPGKFELANEGTILLDEIGEMPLHLQPKLLRVLQEREVERIGESRPIKVDVRVIATTNVSLAAMTERGEFRADLFYRLNVIPLTLPPLRERQSDIPILAEYFATRYATQMRIPKPHLRPDFIARLQLHPWPGNVREFANFMKRVLTLNGSSELSEASFEAESHTFTDVPVTQPQNAVPGTPIRQVERLHLENTLALTNGNRTHAADMLGISLRTLRNKIRAYDLPPRRYA